MTPGHLNVVGELVGDSVGPMVGAAVGDAVGPYVGPVTVGPIVLGLVLGAADVGEDVSFFTAVHNPELKRAFATTPLSNRGLRTSYTTLED